jgi:hypothetical protein
MTENRIDSSLKNMYLTWEGRGAPQDQSLELHNYV